MDRGWVKLWRKSEDSKVFQNEGLWKVWGWCLMQAAHEGHWVPIKVGRGITEVWVEPGQFIFGRYSAAKKLKMAPSTVWKRMLKLQNMRNSDIKSNSKYTVVSIVNWDTYQPDEKQRNSKGDRQGTGKEHIQECKELKEKCSTPKSDPKVTVFRNWFSDLYKEKFKRDFIISKGQYGKVGSQIKNLLSLDGLNFEQLQYLAIEFIKDEDTYLEETGYNFGNLLARAQQNKYRGYLESHFRESFKWLIVNEDGTHKLKEGKK